MVKQRLNFLKGSEKSEGDSSAYKTSKHSSQKSESSSDRGKSTQIPASPHVKKPIGVMPCHRHRGGAPENMVQQKALVRPRPRNDSNVTRATRSSLTSSRIASSQSVPEKLSIKTVKASDFKIPGVEERLVQCILDEVISPPADFGFKDIAGNEEAKQELLQNFIAPQRRPDIFNGLRSPSRGCLLYGPPGNGKTLLVKALANETGFTFLNISASSIYSKWLGEGEKLVRTVFAVARKLQPTLIFIDEIDAILRSRSSDEHETNRKVKNMFLTEMDGINNDHQELVAVIGATNLHDQLDPAAIRRFPLRLKIPLPDFETRRTLIVKLLQQHDNLLTDAQIDEIAERTDGYSSSDITSLTKYAALEPTRGYSFEQLVKLDKTRIRKIEFQDFLVSLEKIKPFPV